MNRASFLKRMAFAALACAFVELPDFLPDALRDGERVWIRATLDHASGVPEYSRSQDGEVWEPEDDANPFGFHFKWNPDGGYSFYARKRMVLEKTSMSAAGASIDVRTMVDSE